MSCHRCTRAAGWIAPAAVIALMPKCPMCVVGYIAMFTGVGITVGAATWIRTSLLVLAGLVLGWFAVRLLLRMATPPPQNDLSAG